LEYVLDAAYGGPNDLAAWGDGVFRAIEKFFTGLGAGFNLVRHDEMGRVLEVPCFRSNFIVQAAVLDLVVDPADFLQAYFPPNVVVSFSGLAKTGARRIRELYTSALTRTGIDDCVSVMVHPLPGLVGGIAAPAASKVPLNRDDRRRLTWLGLHIEAALRLRLRPESLRAVVGPTGRVEHLTPGAPPAGELARAAATIREVRHQHRRGGDALAIWPALVGGELSVVQRTIGTRPHYFFFDNPPHRQPFSQLTGPEQDAVGAIARAESGKSAAYELGITDSALSHRLASATQKLGLSSSIDLVRLGAILAHDPRARFDQIALTPSEQHILELVGRGLSNAEIAQLRSRSARTIANQVAALLRKTRSSNRRALVAKFAASANASVE
jgi:DNA-binding NarL/FixJ family response regulator